VEVHDEDQRLWPQGKTTTLAQLPIQPHRQLSRGGHFGYRTATAKLQPLLTRTGLLMEGLPHALERRRPRDPHPAASQSRVREAEVSRAEVLIVLGTTTNLLQWCVLRPPRTKRKVVGTPCISKSKGWCRRWESNPRPRDYETATLCFSPLPRGRHIGRHNHRRASEVPRLNSAFLLPRGLPRSRFFIAMVPTRIVRSN
jgi:hypothetical protein